MVRQRGRGAAGCPAAPRQALRSTLFIGMANVTRTYSEPHEILIVSVDCCKLWLERIRSVSVLSFTAHGNSTQNVTRSFMTTRFFLECFECSPLPVLGTCCWLSSQTERYQISAFQPRFRLLSLSVHWFTCVRLAITDTASISSIFFCLIKNFCFPGTKHGCGRHCWPRLCKHRKSNTADPSYLEYQKTSKGIIKGTCICLYFHAW